jgi:hypothetical protein
MPALGGIAPLTQRKKDGSPYVRPPDVEAEIAEVVASDPATWSVSVLKSETLVHLVRWLWKRNDLRLIGKVIDCLGKRIAQIARDFSSGLGKSGAEDFAIEIAEELNLLIFAQAATRQSEFLECAFRTAVRRRAINKRTKLRERLKHEKCESSLPEIESDGKEIGIVSLHADGEPAPDQMASDSESTGRTLAAVSNPLHREAFVLHCLQGWPLYDEDETIPTLSTRFGRSPRQIQNWIAKARSEMRTALGDEHHE